jgi:hypothetical protein
VYRAGRGTDADKAGDGEQVNPGADAIDAQSSAVFQQIDLSFTVAFVLELLVHLFAHCRRAPRQPVCSLESPPRELAGGGN